jgi:HK97 family phage prohead protease
VRASSLSREDRTVDVVMSTGAIVRRRGWIEDFDEALPVDRARLERINSIGVVLDSHMTGSVINTLGSVVPGSVRVDGATLVGQIKVARTPAGDAVLGLIADGHIRAVSLGYDVDDFVRTPAKDRRDGGDRTLMTPTSWEPYEVSIVQMPADAGAVMRSAERESDTRKYPVRGAEEAIVSDTTMTTEAAVAYNARLATFERLGAANHVATEKVRALVAEFPHDDNRVGFELLKLAAENQRAAQITSPQPPAGTKIEIGRAAADKAHEAIGLGITHRALSGVDPRRVEKAKLAIEPLSDERSHRARRARLIDLAEQFLEARGFNCAGWSPNEIAMRALAFRSAAGGLATTGDFATLLGNAANKMLAVGYAEVMSPWREFSRLHNRPDFKQFSIFRRSGAPSLEAIGEHGEIKRAGYISGTPLVGQLSTAGIQVGFTRQMLVNDDLDAFSQQSLGLGESAKRWEDDAAVVDILLANPTLNDGTALFHASRGNLATDVGTPDLAALIHVMRLFELMTETVKDASANGGTSTRRIYLTLRGFFGAVSETATIGQIIDPRRYPDAASNALPSVLQGKATWTDPRLAVEASSPDVWFAISNRTCLVHGGLEGDPSPRFEMLSAADTDGTIFQLIHDFYVAVEDPKAIIRVPKS